MAECRSQSPEGDRCTRPKGHDGSRWRHYSPSAQDLWEGGIKSRAHWQRIQYTYPDCYSEGDEQSWRRHG